ncbi:TPA: ead/Ea22-like family protein [Klebsiella oxytoca]|nr:ead/Ea22-like family protein [Klebsiella oxytoca]
MTTDITDLAQSLKAAAEKASGGDWVKESGDGWDATCSNDDQANSGFIIAHFVGPDSEANREFVQLANPANIRALVEALEKAQAGEKQWREVVDAFCADDADWHKLTNSTNELISLLSQSLCKQADRIAELESRTVSASAADLLAERQRQVTAEGWSSKHDDQYKNTELAFAASCYAFHAAAASWDLEDDGIPYDSHPVPKQWPWDPSWWKPTDARRDLVKAGALILAEIERIDRAAGIKWEAE